MKGVRDFRILGEPYLGSVITIQVVFDEAPTSASIRIRDPFKLVKVDNVAMTADSGGLYYFYDYQNVDSDNFGEYLVIIKAVYGSNTVYTEKKFKLYDPDINVSGSF